MRRPLAVVLLLTLALTIALAAGARAEDPPVLEAGMKAPDFRLNDDRGRAHRLSEANEGSWIVLAFYPKAATPGCTREVCSLRDAVTRMERLEAKVFGISLDDVASQRAFAEAQSVQFPLLSDPDASAARRYGVLDPRGTHTQRVTFLIDPAGTIRHVDRTVNVMDHGKDVIDRLNAFLGR
jgi:peroxiredoxin Q/BCP